MRLGNMRDLIKIDRRGVAQITACIGPYALKIARGLSGQRCNRFEFDLWSLAGGERREMLCSVLAKLPFDFAIVMQRAEPISEEEKDRLIEQDAFPDLDYMGPGDVRCPFEYKASDWGRLHGRLMALDYSAPALFAEELEHRGP
jgi:hypothetical protein